MSKQVLFFVCLLSLLNIWAEKESNIRIRPYMFIPSSQLFRDIYGTVNGGIALEAETTLYHHVRIWANIDGLFKHGHSIGFCNPTKIGIANFSVGIKALYAFNDQLNVYAGIGPTFAGVFVRNNSLCCINKISKSSVGAVVKTGFYYFINECIFLDLFVDYLYQSVRFQRKINVGGCKIGLGIGYTF